MHLMNAGLRAIPPSVNGWNAEYLDAEYARFKADPASVSPDLRAFFLGFDLAGPAAAAGKGVGAASLIQLKVDRLIDGYRRFGHLAAKIDPFGRERQRPPQIDPAFHGIQPGDMGQTVDATGVGMGGPSTVKAVVERLESVYCGTIGVEFMHTGSPEEIGWFLSQFEQRTDRGGFDAAGKRRILELITRAETFETFLQKRYPSEKRFSSEGGETMIPVLEHLLELATERGIEEVVVGMPHRGRLTVLNVVLGKTYEQVFTEFEDNWDEGFADSGGDVKYHRGHSGEREFPNGRKLRLSLASNPSHLEAVNPVVLGRVRAKQRLRADLERNRVVPVLFHGDAAVAGQGVVAECINFSRLEGYTVGGCLHIVVNNQIGFTTLPQDGRSGDYCTDIAKSVNVPVIHVNAEDPQSAVWAARLLVEYRQRFKKDVFLDLVCYRKYGHNEQDDPSFTQPTLAAMIKARPGVLSKYAQKLQGEGVIGEAELVDIQRRLDEALDKAQKTAKERPHDPAVEPFAGEWAGIKGEYSHEPAATAVPASTIAEVAGAMSRLPEGFTPNPRLKGVLESRAALAEASRSGNLDQVILTHADAEQLAVGTLLLEGVPVRLSGQDCRRGTFSQRHAVLRDFASGQAFIPLNTMRELGTSGVPELEPGDTESADGRTRQARYCVYDSPLSEFGVMGFDYGYSLADPHMLICWEAQFGDFVNGAQIMIDQFIASSELKWERRSGLVLLLPHGNEGAGPEHSSARLERFLQLCADDNMEVCYPTTGAQVFHMLRRQVKRSFRKPLIVMQVKATLRTPTSTLGELVKGRFHEILDDAELTPAEAKNVKRVLLCSGKVYFDLHQRRKELGRRDVAIIRVEQVHPFHKDECLKILSRYPKTAERRWVQEETRNGGAWMFLSDLFRTDPDLRAAGLDGVEYIGRASSASPSVGSKRIHKLEQEEIVSRAVGPRPASGEEKPKPAAAPAVKTGQNGPASGKHGKPASAGSRK
jgi:2-oxoglutarate dehydrogenase E1 component